MKLSQVVEVLETELRDQGDSEISKDEFDQFWIHVLFRRAQIATDSQELSDSEVPF